MDLEGKIVIGLIMFGGFLTVVYLFFAMAVEWEADMKKLGLPYNKWLASKWGGR